MINNYEHLKLYSENTKFQFTPHFRQVITEFNDSQGKIEDAFSELDPYLEGRQVDVVDLLEGKYNKKGSAILDLRDEFMHEEGRFYKLSQFHSHMNDEMVNWIIEEGLIEPMLNPLEKIFVPLIHEYDGNVPLYVSSESHERLQIDLPNAKTFIDGLDETEKYKDHINLINLMMAHLPSLHLMNETICKIMDNEQE